MKVAISTSVFSTASKTRGVGAYTRELLRALVTRYPSDTFIEAKGNPYRAKASVIHYPFFDPYFLTLPWKFLQPTVITIHDLIPLKYPENFPAGLRGRAKWIIQRYRARHASAIITDSLSSARNIASIMTIPQDRIYVIPLSSATSRTSYTITDKLKKLYKLPANYILYVGDVNWNKNLPGLIQAFAKLKKDAVHLVLVGKVFKDQPDIPQYNAVSQAITSSGKSDHIHLLGYIPSHHLGAIYHGATLYCQPSWDEGFGLPLLEAMKAGCPVLSSNLGSLPEVGGDAAAYFNPKNDDLTTKIDELLSSPAKRDALIKAGLEQVKKFSWKRTAELTMDVYRKV